MSYCAKIPEENQAAALLHYLGISRTRKGYWYIRWILEWGRQEEMDEARFYTRLVRRCKVPRLQMARDMYRALHRVDTLRNYLDGGGIRPGRGVGAAVRSLPVAEPLRGRAAGGVMGGMGWRLRGPEGLCAK